MYKGQKIGGFFKLQIKAPRRLIRVVAEVLVLVWCESRSERLDDLDDVVVFMSLASLETGKDIDNGDDDGADFGG
uniref:Uncharacterized protein n=1 Tax=Cannabis sativa TaxID=3483 RepID=A0A803PK97_CANSA